jgi:hypothetical protein
MNDFVAISALKRLTKGKNGLGREEVRDILEFVKAQPVDEVLLSIFPPKVVRTTASKTPPGTWVAELERAKKRLNWKAAEAIAKFYELAQENGYILKSAPQKTFPKAAQEIASQIGESRATQLFADWVDQFVKTNQML